MLPIPSFRTSNLPMGVDLRRQREVPSKSYGGHRPVQQRDPGRCERVHRLDGQQPVADVRDARRTSPTRCPPPIAPSAKRHPHVEGRALSCRLAFDQSDKTEQVPLPNVPARRAVAHVSDATEESRDGPERPNVVPRARTRLFTCRSK